MKLGFEEQIQVSKQNYSRIFLKTKVVYYLYYPPNISHSERIGAHGDREARGGGWGVGGGGGGGWVEEIKESLTLFKTRKMLIEG